MPDSTTPSPSLSTEPTARSVAMERIAKKAGQFPELPFDANAPQGLDPRDAALAHAIETAVTRRWLTLVAVIESRLTRPWTRVEATLQAALLAGSAQLLFMDRLPDHAVVDETVGWAKRQRGPKAGGFVNAVLRKVIALRTEMLEKPSGPFGSRRDELPLSDGRAWRLAEDVFSAESVDRAREIGSVGRELFLHWIAAHGFTSARQLAEHGLADPPTLVTGVPSSLAGDVRFVAHDIAGWHAFVGDHGELRELLAAHPSLRVQDPASGDPVKAARDAGLQPRKIVDFCAGRGTKTVQLAQTFPGASIVACDPDLERAKDLASAAKRFTNIIVATPAKMTEHFQSADLVVLDVPCSNTAVLPRRPEASYRFTARRLEKLIEKQREVVVGAMPLLAPGGFVLYSTCSLEPTENTRQAEAIRKRFHLQPRGERQRFPTGAPGDPASKYSDGGFWALMQAKA
jgi:16S rRNA (cytosine967-C5)-methyltransferase